MRIAMWSGPRNISTALMRSWGNRSDCFVSDEPLYAHYLAKTGLDHPGRHATIEKHDTNWRSVACWLTGEIPNGKSIWYQKHMAHHLLPEIERQWLMELTHCFLIREPREMITSLIEFLPVPRLDDTGLPQQIKIFNEVRNQSGQIPPVIDGRDVLENPRKVLSKLCGQLDVAFDESMLGWPPGIRETDGAWAPYWYDKVKDTTKFGTYKKKDEAVPDSLSEVLAECQPIYEQLAAYRIR